MPSEDLTTLKARFVDGSIVFEADMVQLIDTLVDRTKHSGSITASEISDFGQAVENTVIVDSVLTATGLEGDSNFGVFPGSTIPDNTNLKVILAAIESKIETIEAGTGNPVESGSVVGNNIVLVLRDSTQVSIPVDALLVDTKAASGAWNSANQSIDITLSDSSVVQIPFADALESAGVKYLPNFATVGDAPTSGVSIDSRTFIGGLLHRFNGTTWVNDTLALASDTGTGTALDLSFLFGTFTGTYATPVTDTSLTIKANPAPVNGGYHSVYGQWASEPTITEGGSAIAKRSGDAFVANAKMEILVYRRNGVTEYRFLAL